MLAGNSFVSNILGNVYLRIIPCVNPKGFDLNVYGNGHFYDGHEYSVNINANYDYMWEPITEGSAYNGPSALSEKESQIVTAWAKDLIDNDKVNLFIDFHTGFKYEIFSFIRNNANVEILPYETLRNICWKKIKAIEPVCRKYYSMDKYVNDNKVIFCGSCTSLHKTNFSGFAEDYAVSHGRNIPVVSIENTEYLNGTDRPKAATLYATLIGNYVNGLIEELNPLDINE